MGLGAANRIGLVWVLIAFSGCSCDSGVRVWIPPDAKVDTSDADNICERVDISGYLRPSTVVFVLDLSGSMADSLGGTTSKWEAAKVAISSVVLNLEDTHEFGMGIFPNPNFTSNGCATVGSFEVPVAGKVSADFSAAFSSLEKKGVPIGATPTTAALRKLRPKLVESGATAVLVTDGAPNCTVSPPPVCLCTAAVDIACQEGATFMYCGDNAGNPVGCPVSNSGRY